MAGISQRKPQDGRGNRHRHNIFPRITTADSLSEVEEMEEETPKEDTAIQGQKKIKPLPIYTQQISMDEAVALIQSRKIPKTDFTIKEIDPENYTIFLKKKSTSKNSKKFSSIKKPRSTRIHRRMRSQNPS